MDCIFFKCYFRTCDFYFLLEQHFQNSRNSGISGPDSQISKDLVNTGSAAVQTHKWSLKMHVTGVWSTWCNSNNMYLFHNYWALEGWEITLKRVWWWRGVCVCWGRVGMNTCSARWGWQISMSHWKHFTSARWDLHDKHQQSITDSDVMAASASKSRL